MSPEIISLTAPIVTHLFSNFPFYQLSFIFTFFYPSPAEYPGFAERIYRFSQLLFTSGDSWVLAQKRCRLAPGTVRESRFSPGRKAPCVAPSPGAGEGSGTGTSGAPAAARQRANPPPTPLPGTRFCFRPRQRSSTAVLFLGADPRPRDACALQFQQDELSPGAARCQRHQAPGRAVAGSATRVAGRAPLALLAARPGLAAVAGPRLPHARRPWGCRGHLTATVATGAGGAGGTL